MSKPDPMDVERVLKCLNGALALQLRSVPQFTAVNMRQQNQVDWTLPPLRSRS